jgi:hypothetical protein
MARICKSVGALLVAVGVVLSITFAVTVIRDEDYARKQLIAERNPGNDMYKLEFGFAQIRRGFQIVFLSGGALLGLNGLTLVLLGSVAGRATREQAGESRP